MKKQIFTFLCLITLAFNATATDYFVDGSVATSGVGTGWGTAFKTVPEALAIADAPATGNRIFIKAGTYVMTNTSYTFTNTSFTLQGGFPASAAGTDITGYDPVANVTTLDYNFNNTIVAAGVIVVNNTAAAAGTTVDIKGLTVTDLGGTGTSFSKFFVSNAASQANTTYSITDMTHKVVGTPPLPQNQGVYAMYEFQNILASNSISFTKCSFLGVAEMTTPTVLGMITVKNSAVAPTITTCTFDGLFSSAISAIIHLENISASPIANIATDNVFKNSTSAMLISLMGNSGDFLIDGIVAPIDNNKGTANHGAFIRAHGENPITNTDVYNAGKITIKNCTITNGTLGAVVIESMAGRGAVEIANNTFTNNTNISALGGGALQLEGSVAAVTDPALFPSFNVHDNVFTGNGASNGTGNGGGAISFSSSSSQFFSYNTVSVTNNTFNNNTSGISGGAINLFNMASANPISITNNNFSGNTAQSEGGAISERNVRATSNIIGNSFCSNRVIAGEGAGIAAANNFDSANPTIDYALNITSNVFYDNRASATAAAIYVINGSSVHIKTSTFTQNACANGSTAIFLSTLHIQSDIDQCVFVENVGGGVAPAINVSPVGVKFNITKCNFTNNRSTGNTTAGIVMNPSTAAMQVTVEECLFDGNNSLTGSGAIATGISIPNATTALVKKCIFRDNYIGFNPLVTTTQDSDLSLGTIAPTFQATVTDSYLQAPLTTTNYIAANNLGAAGNVQITSANTFAGTVANGCAAVPLVYQLGVGAVGSIDCNKTQISPAPVAGTASQLDLIVTIDVTTAGTFEPIMVSGSGMSLANNVNSITATTTGIQTFHIPIKYDGTGLGTLNFQVGATTACTADLTLAPKQAICPIWTLDNCSPVQVGPVLK